MHSDFGYIDLQVNGYADVDFNADELIRLNAWRHVYRRIRDDAGSECIRLATVIDGRPQSQSVTADGW